MSVFVGAPGSVPSNKAGVTGAFELNTIVYVRFPAESNRLSTNHRPPIRDLNFGLAESRSESASDSPLAMD